MISIIVVSLNTKKDFKKTIKSIINQKVNNYEIIVVDGNSKDGTLDYIKKYKKLFNKVIAESDRGIYYAMNKGIKVAKKDWIIFLNSGDLFANKNTLKKIINYTKSMKEDILIGNTIINKSGIFFKHTFTELSENSFNSSFSHQSTITRSKILKKRMFYTKYKIASDYDFFRYALKKKIKFKYINDYLSITKSGGLSDLKRIKTFNEFYEINRKYNSNLYFPYFIHKLSLIKYFFFYLIKKIIPIKIITKIYFKSTQLKI